MNWEYELFCFNKEKRLLGNKEREEKNIYVKRKEQDKNKTTIVTSI